MNRKRYWRWLSLAVVLTMLVAMVPGLTIAQVAEEPKTIKGGKPASGEKVPVAGARAFGAVDMEGAVAKLHPDLRDLALSASPSFREGASVAGAGMEPVLIQVFASVGRMRQEVEQAFLDQLLSYFGDNVLIRPALGKGEQKTRVIIGEVEPANILKIASLAQVETILKVAIEVTGQPDVYPADEPRPVVDRSPERWAELRGGADAKRGADIPWNEAKAFGDGREVRGIEGWYETSLEGPHKAQAAWDRGFMGEGVTVSVLDDGIDFGHPDLMGTQKIYNSTVNPEYNGWPMTFSPFSMMLYFLNPLYSTYGQPGMGYADTSATPDLTPCGIDTSCFDYSPLIDWATWTGPYTYAIDNSMTQSGVVHVGTHPDVDLRDFVWGEMVAVLLTDPNTAGVYDTVYVDLDADYDFRDEKPLTKADTSSPATLAATYNDMVAYRDLNADGLADVSGGLLYWIADGNPIPASDWLYGSGTGLPGTPDPPAPADMVAFTGGSLGYDYSHGTQCASNVVGQGVVQNANLGYNNDFLPAFRDLPGDGKPASAVQGQAPEAKVVDISDIYWNHASSKIDAYIFAAVGWDGIDQTDWDMLSGPSVVPDTDAIQITSNSYGQSDTDNDGWEYDGQVASQVQRWYAPNLQFLFSTGNGAPGYGTTAPPSPATGIAVGASTQFGSTGWDTITETVQIMNNDVTPFSNRGPGARDSAGVDVVAGGAFASGAQALNFGPPSVWGVLDGNMAWDSWGGTSRSAPVAMGILALIYEAYKDEHGSWPTHEQAKALLMSSATDLNYDVFVQGAGSVNADVGTAVAGGLQGIYTAEDSASWVPGDYRGDDWPGFAHVVYPGDTWNKTFTVLNDSAVEVTADVSATQLELIDTAELDLTVTAAMAAAEQDNFYKAFNYMIPITAAAGFEGEAPDWYNVQVPADTDLMIVRQMFPFEEFDYDGDYAWDNRFYLMVYNWMDVNGDGDVWEDKDSNGVVNFANASEVTLIDYGTELEWDDPITELDRWEYGRFSYHRPGGNRNEMWVHDPLERMHDGLFIGLRHHPGSTYPGDTHLSYRIEFYRKADVPWLTVPADVTVGAGGDAGFGATVNVPGDMPPGDYEAAIEILDPSPTAASGMNNIVIPVVLHVAADYEPGLTLGGEASYIYDQARPYNNAAVRGLFDWTWRAESGDWRFFYMDLENCEDDILYEEDFEAGDGGWTVGGSSPSWGWGPPLDYDPPWTPSGAHSGANVWGTNLIGPYNADEWSYIESPEIDLSAYAGRDIYLNWWEWFDVENAPGGGCYDFTMAEVSKDGGASWDVVEGVCGSTADWYPAPLFFDGNLGPDYAVSNFKIRIGMYADFVTEWAGVYIDDVVVSTTGCFYAEGSHLLVKDVWDDAAPMTDIDTIVLGPTETALGSGWYDFPEPDFYGPYVLDTVAKSVVDRAGGATWRFNTTSGGNEEWVSVPFPDWTPDRDGLHRILQHNVVFEGDQFDVVFEKSVGTLEEDVHEFSIETFVDSGYVGSVTVESALELNGLETDGFMIGRDVTLWEDEWIEFIDSNTNELLHDFEVSDGVLIDVATSSSTISDIDLFLYYWDGANWQLRGASTTSSADEHVAVENPEDGLWRIGVNNWSGPAGTFNMVLEVQSRVPGIMTDPGSVPGPIAAGTPVEFDIYYDLEMPQGVCLEGVVFLGPPEAPRLKEIPIEICRHEDSAGVEKDVDWEISFPGHELEYEIPLANYSDPGATLEFIDVIPDGTTYVDHWTEWLACPVTLEPADSLDANGNGCPATIDYEAGNNRLYYNGPLPPTGGAGGIEEGFEDGLMPPTGWSVEHLGATENEWTIVDAASYPNFVHSGDYAAWVNWDGTAASDEWLFTPWFTPTASAYMASFWVYGNTNWPGATLKLHAVMSDTSTTLLWDAIADEVWDTSAYRLREVDLSAYADQPIELAWQYVGLDGDSYGLDDVSLPGESSEPGPAAIVHLTVLIDEGMDYPECILNEATLQATHYLPQETQVEELASAEAETCIGESVFGDSHKKAPEEAVLGDVIEYVVVVENTGDELVEVTMVDPLPDGTEYVWHDTSPPYQHFAYNAGDDQMEWTGNVAAGERLDFTFEVELVSMQLWGDWLENRATITWDSGEMDLDAMTWVQRAPHVFHLPQIHCVND